MTNLNMQIAGTLAADHRRYMAEILPIRRKTLSYQSMQSLMINGVLFLT